MSATPSEEAMGIVERYGSLENHNMLCPRARGVMGDCICDRCDVDKMALAITALVARRVEEERERCAQEAMSLHVYDDERPQAYVKGWCDAAKVIAAAIRTTPPRGEK